MLLSPSVMGKSEGSVAQETWHGHVTALTVAPEYRRLGLAAKMMNILEEVSDRLGLITTSIAAFMIYCLPCV